MYKRFTGAFIAILLIPGAASAANVGKWHSGEVDGFTRYWTTNKVGSSFVVWCHPDRKVNGTLLHIVIDGKTPTPNTRLKLVLDQEILELPVNDQGYIDTGCATCSDSFGYIWHRLRAAHSMAVKFYDQRYAGFSLKGAPDILPGKVCPTDFQKKQPNS